jgi:hypothetical protein
MKRIVLALTFVLATSSVAAAQFGQGTENLRGLRGVRVMVIYGHCPTRDVSKCAAGLEEAQRPEELLKMLEADVTEKLQKAGIPLFQTADEITNTGFPYLVVEVTLKKLNRTLFPIETQVRLYQRVRLLRDLSIETDAVTWSMGGSGGPKIEIAKIRRLVGSGIDRFIADYQSVNPKESATVTQSQVRDQQTLKVGSGGFR